jgi:hypothetical protein
MGLQKKAPIPSRLSGNAKTTTVTADKIPTVTLSNDDVKKTVINYTKQKALTAAEIVERQRKLKEQAIVDNVAKEQEELKNSITFFKTPSNEDFEKLMDCYKNLPHTLKNIEVRNMRSSYDLDLDLDNEDWEELELDDDFEGVSIKAERDGNEEIFLNLPMQEDFVKAINANTENLKEKYNTLRSRYIGTDDEGHEIIIKPFDEEYQIEYNNIVTEEHEFLFGENSIIDMFNESKEDVIDELVKKNPKDKEFKNDFKKLKKNLKIEVNFSDPIKVVTSIDYDANGIITKVHRKSINTKMTLTLKYPKKSGGTPKKIYSETFNLLDN